MRNALAERQLATAMRKPTYDFAAAATAMLRQSPKFKLVGNAPKASRNCGRDCDACRDGRTHIVFVVRDRKTGEISELRFVAAPMPEGGIPDGLRFEDFPIMGFEQPNGEGS